ncbi:holo-ACP synthase [Mycoplasmopsis lipofaciens]|uniref:holo-ACP synthase n=1 Tax=Mycoplasmopsis lipofaciens TaxID=114884 RepID=UPI0004813978|nr:4'-phosphopantetheinyl transferase superfamily protein [Mycoplasmopsis lipofaciens]
MLGVDLVRIDRFQNVSKNFETRFLNQNEYKYYLNIEDKYLKSVFLASIWAIKEAMFKADNSYINFKNIELQKIDGAWFHDKFYISISHEENMLVAVAIKK